MYQAFKYGFSVGLGWGSKGWKAVTEDTIRTEFKLGVGEKYYEQTMAAMARRSSRFNQPGSPESLRGPNSVGADFGQRGPGPGDTSLN